ncbi:MAG: glycosyltransferase family 4 protein [Agriterribacter sp.]
MFDAMRIAIVTDGIWPFVVGGMQKHSYNLCKYLCASGVKVSLFHPMLDAEDKKKIKDLFSDGELENLEWVDVPDVKKYSFFGHYLYESYQYSKHCYALLKERNDIDFIYAKGLTSWYVLTQKKTFKCAVGIKIHGYEFLQIKPNRREKISAIMLYLPFKYIHKRADYVFSYGPSITEYIQRLGVPENKIVEIPGAVDAEWLIQTRAHRSYGTLKKFVFIGRNERRKGIEEINEVLTKEGLPENTEFHFIGPIPEEKKVNIPEVFYHGAITDKAKIIDILDRSDILVCPSYSEGMPNVIMEAMARGCAIIATNVGAVPVLVDKTNGWLIQPASVYQLRDAIYVAAMMDYKQLELMGQISLDRISNHYTWPIIIDLFKNLLSTKRKPDE